MQIVQHLAVGQRRAHQGDRRLVGHAGEFRRPNDVVDQHDNGRPIVQQLLQGLPAVRLVKAVDVVEFGVPDDLDAVGVNVVERPGNDAGAGIALRGEQSVLGTCLAGNPGQLQPLVQGLKEVPDPNAMRHGCWSFRSG